MNEYIQIKNQFGCGFCPTFILKMSFSSVSMHRLISLSQQPERENGKQRTDQWESQLNYRLSTLDDDFIRKVKKQLKWTGEKNIFLFRNTARTPIILKSLETSAGHFHFMRIPSPSFFFFWPVGGLQVYVLPACMIRKLKKRRNTSQTGTTVSNIKLKSSVWKKSEQVSERETKGSVNWDQRKEKP